MSAKAVTADDLDITFVGALTAPGQVRTLVEFRLTEWGLLNIAHDVYLVAGELVANAVQSMPEGRIRVRFTRETNGVLLGVWDSSDEMPVSKSVVELSLADITPDAEALDAGHDDGTGGWGLPIVEALSSRCGVSRTPPRGKWVWARISL